MRRASLFCKCVVLFGDGLFVGRSYWERAVYPWRRSAFFGGRPVLSWRRSDLFWRGSRHVGSRCEKRAGTFSTRGRIYLIRGEGPPGKNALSPSVDRPSPFAGGPSPSVDLPSEVSRPNRRKGFVRSGKWTHLPISYPRHHPSSPALTGHLPLLQGTFHRPSWKSQKTSNI